MFLIPVLSIRFDLQLINDGHDDVITVPVLDIRRTGFFGNRSRSVLKAIIDWHALDIMLKSV